MTGRTLATALVGVIAVAAALASVALAALARPGPPVDEAAVALAVTTYTLVALVIEHARPGHRVGRLLLLGAATWGLGEGALALGLQGYLYHPGSVPAADLLAVTGTVVRGIGWLVLVLAVPLVFPDGDLPWGRRSPALLVAAAITLFTAAGLLSPVPLEFRLERMDSPTGLPAELRPVTDLMALTALGLCVVALGVAVAAVAHRWRAGDTLRRQQLLWLCGAFAVPLAFLPLISTPLVDPWMFAVVTLPVPLAIGVAMLQRRLYDVQLALSRTLTYLALSAAVAGLYALTVGGVGALLREPGSPWLPWLAAGVVAVSFAPLRQALQQGVNRLTYGRWAQPADVLAATGRRLADAADVPRLLGALVGELGSGLGLRQVQVRDGSGRILAAYGDAAGPVDRLPLLAYGREVGSLVFSRRRLRETDRRLLADLAGQLGGVVHAAALLEDLRRARQRLVLAREEERRRLRRDLHDGLGPALASLTLQVDTLRNRLAAPPGVGPAQLDDELVRLRTAIQATVVDVRRLVEGLRPPALDELGLSGALEQAGARLAGDGLSVDVDVAPLPALPAAVEVALFRVAQEALTNVARHAGARRALLRVAPEERGVTLLVSDDGRGGAAPRSGGLGLAGMRERAAEIGGTLDVESRPGEGTVVRLHLPLAGRPEHAPTAPPDPATAGPGSAGPATAGPGSAGPATADPGSADPATAGPASAGQGPLAEGSVAR